MSVRVIKFYSVFCDDCDASGPECFERKVSEDEARMDGFRRKRGTWLCPDCIEKHEEPRP